MGPGFLALVRAAAAQAARDPAGMERELARVARAVEEGEIRTLQVEEALLQSYLFLGYPAALEALAVWRRVSGLPPEAGAEDGGSEEGAARWRIRGPRVCTRVYGDQAEALRENIGTLHPALATWMVEEGYGKVLGRPGLALRDRELLVATLLAVQDAPRQLHSHLRGALRAGVRPFEVEAVLEALEPWVPDPGRRARIQARWERVRERFEAGSSSGTGPGPGHNPGSQRGFTHLTPGQDPEES